MPDTTWADAIAASGSSAPARTPITSASPWERARDEAARLGPGLYGCLLWVEARCVNAGLHPMDPQWLWHFEEFYASGKFLDVGRFGLRAAKSASVCRALVAETLLLRRKLEPSIVGVCPIMSSNMREAGDRFDTVKAILRACGLQDITGRRNEEPDGSSFKWSGGGQQALVIALQDAQGHAVEFRIYPASVSGAAGFTGVAGFGDELDLWGKAGSANPSEDVVKILVSRYTTQPEAKLHMMSATYDRESYHAEMIGRGDTPLQRVARLGLNGALKDTADRARLAKAIGSMDALLIEPSDPLSTDIPTWVSNPIAPIEDCYAKSDGDLAAMFGLYGGRPNLSGGSASVEAQLILAAQINNRIAAARRATSQHRVPLMTVSGAPPGDPRHPGAGAEGRPERVPTWRERKLL